MKTIQILALATILLSACQPKEKETNTTDNSKVIHQRTLDGIKGPVKTFLEKSYDDPIIENGIVKDTGITGMIITYKEYSKEGDLTLYNIISRQNDDEQTSLKYRIENEMNKESNILNAHYYRFPKPSISNSDPEPEYFFTKEYNFKDDTLIVNETDENKHTSRRIIIKLNEDGYTTYNKTIYLTEHSEVELQFADHKYYSNGNLDSISNYDEEGNIVATSRVISLKTDKYGNPTQLIVFSPGKDTSLYIQKYTYYR